MSKDTPPHTRGALSLRAEHRLLAIGVATLGLYVATWVLELAMFRNGVRQATVIDPASVADESLLTWQMMLYGLVTVVIFWAYLAVINMCRRGELATRRARLLALAVPVILNLVCLLWIPRLSTDTLSYVAHGFLGLLPGQNPLLQPPDDVHGTDLGARLAAFGWHGVKDITPYGILWTRLEIAVANLSAGTVLPAALMFKVIAMSASLGSAWMIWLALGRLYPALQLQGTLAYLWNPLIIMEFAGEGHNDALMIFFSIAALVACIANRPTMSLIAQLLGAMTKYISLLYLPGQLMYLWRTRRTGVQLALQIATALAVSMAVAAVLYLPLWAGLHTFDGLARRVDSPTGGLASLFGTMRWFLKHSPLKPFAPQITVAVLTVAVLAFVAWSSLRVKDAMDLARTCAWTSLAFFLVAAPDYWPWYVCTPIAWIIVGELNRLFWLALLMSFFARLLAPIWVISLHGHIAYQVAKGTLTGLGSFLPLVALGVWCGLQWQRRRFRAPNQDDLGSDASRVRLPSA
jgi:hypothetical protein